MSAYWHALLSALEGNATDCAASILLRIHIGSPQAGLKVAAILSVVESCRRLKVPVRDYSSSILRGLADLPIRVLPDLTPAVWVARHS